MFVVQKHAARRAGLHWDFRLEHGGVLWSWAVPKGPSLDPADRRMAIHVEDHPIEYADFEGAIPEGEYGGGNVEIWDRGTWLPSGDPDEALRAGEIRFVLSGQRLNGRFTLVRTRRRRQGGQEAWFLIKGHDEDARVGASAPVLEQEPISPEHRGEIAGTRERPAPGAVRGAIQADQPPQLCQLVEEPPVGPRWISEIKFDGYRLLAWVNGGKVRLVTRNGHDWADRLPAVASAVARLPVRSAVLDGELVALRADGVSNFPDLQVALSAGRDRKLFFYVFDLLELDGWDLRACTLIARKAVLETLTDWTGMLRFSAHAAGDTHRMRRDACRMGLEGIVCKKADATYKAGRGGGWLKLKCTGRDEFIVLGWTQPRGSRSGIGALHLGYFDPNGRLHYAGAVGTGFSEQELVSLRNQLNEMEAAPPDGLLIAGDPLDSSIRWVRAELIVEVQYAGWSGGGRVRHAVYLGRREDKSPRDVVRDIADPEAERGMVKPRSKGAARGSRPAKAAIPPIGRVIREAPPSPSGRSPEPRVDPGGAALPTRIVVARRPGPAAVAIGDVELSHPDRQLWPGITKRDLAEYWQAVADHALPGLASRPLSIVRCPDGIGGEHFFQKNGHGHLPLQIREGSVSGSPYLAIDDVNGLIALARMSAIELHPWGASEADPLHPDRLVFDLDPGEGVAFGAVVAAAHEVRDRLMRLGLRSFCRTTGGKGLHVVVPLTPSADWDTAKRFCRAFAALMAQDDPAHFLAHVKLADRRGRILIDWLRNGMGATAVASYCPRARAGAGVATPLGWDEVNPGLDPADFTISTVPERLRRARKTPWPGFAGVDQRLPAPAPAPLQSVPIKERTTAAEPGGDRKKSAIVVASRPKRRR